MDTSVYLFFILFPLFCIFILIGAIRKWKWLIDPPENLRWIYSQSALRFNFGSDTTRFYTIVVSSLMLLFYLYILIVFLKIKMLLNIYIAIITISIISIVIVKLIKIIKQAKVDKTPLPDFSRTENNEIVCNKCGYKQKQSKCCSNCFYEFKDIKK